MQKVVNQEAHPRIRSISFLHLRLSSCIGSASGRHQQEIRGWVGKTRVLSLPCRVPVDFKHLSISGPDSSF